MHGMKIRNIFIAVLGAVFILPSYGLIEELDLYAWQEDEPLPRGWSSDKLKKAAEGKEMYGGAYFDAKAGWLRSPVFDFAIRSVTLYVSTSTPNPTRFMYLQPMRGGAPVSERISVEKTPTREYVARTFEIAGSGVDQFELNIDGSGSDGSWAVIYIIVRYGRLEAGEDDGKPSDFWALSSFAPKPGIRRADFSPLGGVIPGASSNLWQNGKTVRGFHAFAASDPCTGIKVGRPSSNTIGLYMIVTNDMGGSLRALAILGTSGGAADLLLPVALDHERRIERLSVGYRVWSLGGSVPTDLSFSYRFLDGLANLKDELAAKWTVVEEAAWCSDAPGSAQMVDIPPKRLCGQKCVCFRWGVADRAHSSIIGISDVRVSAELEPSGFAVIIK